MSHLLTFSFSFLRYVASNGKMRYVAEDGEVSEHLVFEVLYWYLPGET
jgi:hypothetical protein